MKTRVIFISLLFILFGCVKKQRNTSVKNLYVQEMESQIWKTSSILGDSIEEPVVNFITDNMHFGKKIGFFTDFKNKSFTSKYVSHCGNEYFTNVYGKYEFYDEDKIMFSIDSIVYSGEWKKPVKYLYGKEIDFVISKNKNSIIFTRI